MKRVLLLLAAIAVVMSACSDTSKAKKLAQEYLNKNSNDGKIEIVEAGELQDYMYESHDKENAQMVADAIKELLDAIESDMAEYEGKTDEFSVSMYEDDKKQYEEKKAEYEEALKEVENAVTTTTPMKKMNLKIRGKNAFNATITQDVTMYFNKELTEADVKPGKLAK